MTPKNIRDIVAYWGTSCIYRVNKPKWEDCSWDGVRDGYWTEPHYSDVDNAQVNQHLVAEIYADNTTIENFKLCLRSIASLTDEEIKQCWLLEAPWYVEGDWYSLRRYDDAIAVVGLALMFTGKFVRFTPSQGLESTRPLDNYYAVGSYLQSIGVYVPGTIDEQYVQLI